ncbi:YfcE family phosphodiesterase [bacterium]|nr:YfcE family phosphodiesterase [bacterium]
MKVALIGDVHANLPALEAVLADAHQREVEAIWNVGDSVGYGAFPEEVIQRLQQESVLSIVGNYDIKVLKVKKKKGKLQKNKIPEIWFAFNWAYDNLSKARRKYLRSLPKKIRLEQDGKRILLTHGSPDSNEEHLKSETSEERLRELAEMANADVIICGHSHQPFKRKVGDVWFINTGSVGRPDDGDPRACYAILNMKPGFFQLRHYRIEYDVAQAVAAIREHDLPEAFAQMVLQGRGLDAVLETLDMTESEADEAVELEAPETSDLEISAAAEDKEVTDTSDSTVSEDDFRLKAVLELAENCEYEEVHTHQVTRLALLLFDELQPIHHFGAGERFWLQCGALLHDIGWIEGWKGHHKTALRTIRDTKLLPFDNQERLIIGSIARYHRRALPKKKHAHFAALKSYEREVVSVLAGILRVADGLDRTHQSLVENLSCEVNPDEITVHCSVKHSSEEDQRAALKKGRLLEKVFNRKLVIELETVLVHC